MRVRSLLRRVEMERGGDPTDRDITVGDLRFSGDEKQLFCREKPLALSPNEMKMLLFLMRGEGKAFSRDELLTHIWGYNDEVETRVTDETLRRIRSKLSSATQGADRDGLGLRLPPAIGRRREMKHIRRKITVSVLGTMLFVFAVLLATVNIFIPEYLT